MFEVFAAEVDFHQRAAVFAREQRLRELIAQRSPASIGVARVEGAVPRIAPVLAWPRPIGRHASSVSAEATLAAAC